MYEPTSQLGIDETAAIQTDVPTSNEVEWWHTDYARNKVECEELVLDAFGESNALIIRPGMVMGPYDPVNFFTYWVLRMYRGDDIIAPAIGDQPLQFIDARDLGEFTSELIDRSPSGVFTVDGPAEPLTVATFLETLQNNLESESTIHWIEEEWLLAHDLGTPWEVLPYWLPGDAAEGYCRMSNTKAMNHGLTFRSFTESADDVLDWHDREELNEREEWSHGLPPNRGLSPAKETEMLEEYHADSKGVSRA